MISWNMKSLSFLLLGVNLVMLLTSVQSSPSFQRTVVHGSQQSKRQALPATDPAQPQIFSGIKVYPYYSYLYYYPTMHWTFDKTPDTDDYWIGIYKKSETDNRNYLTYTYIKKTAQGSYYIGKLGNTKGMCGSSRYEEYELRVFSGHYQRLDAQSNILRGNVNYSPSNPFAQNAEQFSNIQYKELEEFFNQISEIHDNIGKFNSIEDLRKQWDNFTYMEQKLILPILEQDSLPDSIKQADPKELDLPEPKVRFPDLNNVEGVSIADLDGSRSGLDGSGSGHNQPISPTSPNKIVLTITLKYSYTYVYPVLYVKHPVRVRVRFGVGIGTWMGIYRTQSTLNFDPKGSIDWRWVDLPRVTKLNYIKESTTGPTSTQYVGPVFSWHLWSPHNHLIGIAATTIDATISVGAPLPPAIFEPNYDKDTALHFAKLSQLAYQEYSVVEQQIDTFNLKAVLRIYDASTDTNGFVASSNDTVVVAFRGTVLTSFKNLLTDLEWIRKPIINGQPFFAQRGFLTAINKVYNTIEAELTPHLGTKKLYVTGHSLGGALATLFGFLISFDYGDAKPTQYVYGCPPVGDIKLAEYFHGMDSNTITIQGDPIATGIAIRLTAWRGFYQPYQVKYLPKAAGHGIANYIQQLEHL